VDEPAGRSDPSNGGLADLLGDIPLFASLDVSLRQEIAGAAEVIRIPAGEYLFHEGDVGDALYAVFSGRLEVEGSEDGAAIGVLGPGAAVGELSLLTGGPRTASVRAIRDSELIAIDRTRFHHLLAGDPRFAAAITTVLGHRLAATVRSRGERSVRRSVISVVGLSAGLPVAAVAAGLEASVARWTSVGSLEASSSGEGSTEDDVAFGRALDRAERAHDVVVLHAAHGTHRTWSEFCVRQGDRVLFVVDPAARPEGHLPGPMQRRDVAFVSTRPPAAADVRAWSEALAPRACHWLPSGSGLQAGVQRTTRRLFGRSVGVVLSGGGARGLAHVGVLMALLDAGVQVDRFGGTSIGAFVSALFATGRTPVEVREVLRRELVERRPFADYTLPRKALIRSYRGRRMFERVFGGLCVEELPHDWFGVSADLLTAETLVHRQGAIRHIVAASMSLPGLVPPLPWGGRLLVDGGVTDNLPVGVMADTGEGPVVGVEVMRRWRDEWDQRLERGAGARRGFTAPPRVPMPSIVETIVCASVLGSSQRADRSRERAALLVAPELATLSLLDWGRLDEAIAEGRRAGRDALAAAAPDTLRMLGI
jgi:NTE family protein